MNHAVIPQMSVVDGRPVTTSLNVAEVFGKRHDRVLRAIDNLEVPEDFNRLNFGVVKYLDGKGEPRKMFNITRDGFTLLGMGFTGKKAMRFKLAYIEAFNMMESELMSRPADRRVDVNYFRATNAPHGLDIKYTLDLTRLLARPNRRTISLLSRITGIDMNDIMELSHGVDTNAVESLVFRFVDECCELDGGYSVSFATVYKAYGEWYQLQGEAVFMLASKSLFSRLLSVKGFGRAKPGGVATVIGLRLVGV